MDVDFRQTVLRAGALLGSTAILVMGNGLLTTLLGVRASAEGMADESIGLMMSAYFAGYAGAPFVWPRSIETVGHIRTFAALTAIGSVVALLHAFFVSPVVWTGLRLIQGLCYGGLIMVIESWLNATVERPYRGRVLALYASSVFALWAVGQPLLNLAPVSGFNLFCLVSICVSLSVVPIALARVHTPTVVPTRRMGIRQLYTVSPVGIAGVFVAGLCFSAFIGMGPAFARTVGMGNRSVAAFMALALSGAVLSQWPLGAISDRIDRRAVLLLLSVATGVIALMLGLNVSRPVWVLLVLSFLFGSTCVPAYSICVAEANDRVEQTQFISVAGSLVLVYGAGSAVGPLLGSMGMGRAGAGGLFISLAMTELLFVGFAVYRIPKREAVLQHIKKAFVHVPQTTPLIAQLRRGRNARRP